MGYLMDHNVTFRLDSVSRIRRALSSHYASVTVAKGIKRNFIEFGRIASCQSVGWPI